MGFVEESILEQFLVLGNRQFNQENLSESLGASGIDYVLMKEVGGFASCENGPSQYGLQKPFLSRFRRSLIADALVVQSIETEHIMNAYGPTKTRTGEMGPHRRQANYLSQDMIIPKSWRIRQSHAEKKGVLAVL